jgi:hypothetical protein
LVSQAAALTGVRIAPGPMLFDADHTAARHEAKFIRGWRARWLLQMFRETLRVTFPFKRGFN